MKHKPSSDLRVGDYVDYRGDKAPWGEYRITGLVSEKWFEPGEIVKGQLVSVSGHSERYSILINDKGYRWYLESKSVKLSFRGVAQRIVQEEIHEDV